MKRAFTFIEILMALIIIAVAGALGLNAYVAIRDDMRLNTLRVRIKQLNVAKQQFIGEYGRLEAERLWGDTSVIPAIAPVNQIGLGEIDTFSNRRYHFLKRYIERPQAAIGEVSPLGTTISTPATINQFYSGTITLDRDNTAVNVIDTISIQ